MSNKSTRWQAERVTLVPKGVDPLHRKQLLTELAQILYDLSCQFREESLPATSCCPEGLQERRSQS